MRLIDADMLKDVLERNEWQKKMSDLIDRDKLRKEFDFTKFRNAVDYHMVNKAIDEQQAIDPLKRGHWITMNEDKRGFADIFKCSVCESAVEIPHLTNHGNDYDYCPWCGARMDADSDDKETVND